VGGSEKKKEKRQKVSMKKKRTTIRTNIKNTTPERGKCPKVGEERDYRKGKRTV